MSQKGLTLAELLISSSIAVVVGGLILVMTINSSGLFYKQAAKVNLGLNADDALTKIGKSIKESRSVVALYSTAEKTYKSESNQLVLKIPSVDSYGNLISEVFDYFVFLLDERKLRLRIFPNILSSRKGQDQILAKDVDQLLFQYFNSRNPPEEVLSSFAAKVKTSLVLKETKGTTEEINMATHEANLRND